MKATVGLLVWIANLLLLFDPMPACAKDDGAEMRAGGVLSASQTVEQHWSVEIGLAAELAQDNALDEALSVLQRRTNAPLMFPKKTGKRSVSIAFGQPISRLALGHMYWELQSIAGVKSVRVRSEVVPKAASVPDTVERVVGLILSPLAGAGEAGMTDDAGLTATGMNSLIALTGYVFPISATMAGGQIVLRFAAPLSLEDAELLRAKVASATFLEWADLDVIDEMQLVPNDAFFGNQWNLSGPWGINGPQAWDISTGTPSVVVAVLDTGILYSHPDLSPKIVGGYDMISDPARSRDGDGMDANASDMGDWAEVGDCGRTTFKPSSWHGSHVAGIIAAKSNNSYGVSGVAWDVRIVPVRVLGKCGGSTSDIINGMYWAAGLPVPGVPTNPNPARILNMSLGSQTPKPTCSPSYQAAVDAVNSAGALIVVAAGNNGQSQGEAGYYEPSGCPGVIAVAASDHLGYRSTYSNYSTEFVVALSAPGGDSGYYQDITKAIYSTVDIGSRSPVGPGGAWYNGTSQAAPHISGILALMLSARPTLTNKQLFLTLIETTREFPTTSGCYRDSVCGLGIANAHAALIRATTDPADDVTQATVTSRNNPVTSGSAFTLDALVTPANAAGTVTFLNSGQPLVGCDNLPLVGGKASCQFSNWLANTSGYHLSAVYNGDYTHHWSYSDDVVQIVLPIAPPPPTGILNVIEYHHASFDHYFITPVAAEIALLDAHAPPFQDWSRTGFSFKVYAPATAPAGSVATCRFFNTHFAPKSSHFYASRGFGCEATIAGFPDWGLEDDKLFYTMLPSANGTCPAGTIPVYRLYNNGMGAAPNHRFVTSLTERQKMIDKGYVAEGNGIGVGMCVPT